MDYYKELIKDKKITATKADINKVVKLELEAALSAQQMQKQYSQPKYKSEDTSKFNLIFKRDGLDYEDYEKMLRDPQIKSGFELIRMFLLSRKLIVNQHQMILKM